MSHKANLAKALRLARVRAGLSQTEVARRIGRTRQTVNSWESEKGGAKPPPEMLSRLADLYGVSEEALRRGELTPVSATSVASPTYGVTVTGPAPPRGLSQRVRVWLQEFLLELARGGATDQEIESARRLLVSEEAHAFYSGGHTDLSEEDLLIEMQGLAEGIRRRLRLRGRQV
jgi:transcriptional regulator with XRE-family HTH domain